MVVYELASAGTVYWFATLGQAIKKVTDLGLEDYRIDRLTLSTKYKGDDLAWILEHRDAFVVKRERVASG
jgi:hypothetical protein